MKKLGYFEKGAREFLSGISKHKSSILRRMNWIRQELTAYEKQVAEAFVTIAYKGAILDKLALGE